LKPPYLIKRFTPCLLKPPVDNSENPLYKTQNGATRIALEAAVVSGQRWT
jgi:hypothetical protein